MSVHIVTGSLLVASLASALGAQGRSTLVVGVADVQSGAPIGNVEVVLPELRLVTRTDSLGQARIPDVPLGDHRVRVRLLGYTPSDVTLHFAGDTTGVVFRLDRTSTRLTAVDVTVSEAPAEVKDFERRRKQGIGRFLTVKDLTKDANRDFMLVASQKFPGVTMRTEPNGQVYLVGTRAGCGGPLARPSSGANRGVDRLSDRPGQRPIMESDPAFNDRTMSGSCDANDHPCRVAIFLDNMNLGEADTGIIRTWDLSGAEYYTGSSMPVQYRTSETTCGALLLWSKWS